MTPKKAPAVARASPKPHQAEHVQVCPTGSLVIEVHGTASDDVHRYRVSTSVLQKSSRYFENLLHPTKFGEGIAVAARHAQLRQQYKTIDQVPFEALPTIEIRDVGQAQVSSVRHVMEDYLGILHAREIGLVQRQGSPSVSQLANLLIVAERFDTLTVVADYMKRHRLHSKIEVKQLKEEKGNSTPAEERTRQLILVGLLLGLPAWVSKYTAVLIIRGSERWKSEPREDSGSALWWDLPSGIEEELICRRRYVLETIESVQSYYLKAYCSRERQCKLGYDTSLQCDSFQLGEMVRFFARQDTLRLQGTIAENHGADPYTGDIDRLIDSLRQCPEYQINSHHSHCGLRTRILPHLAQIQACLWGHAGDLSICLYCWKARRSRNAWTEAKRPLVWNRFMMGAGRMAEDEGERCLSRHKGVRDMFTAVDRIWAE